MDSKTTEAQELLPRKDAREIARLPISQLDEGEVNLLQLPKEWCVWRDGDDLVYGSLRPSDSGDVEGLVRELLEDVREAQLQGHFNHKAYGWLTGFKQKLLAFASKPKPE